jgi:hypothetical protein
LLYPFAKFQYYDGGKKFEKMLGYTVRLWIRVGMAAL